MSFRKIEGKVHDLDRCRGRGTTSCAAGRFESFGRDEFDDGWSGLADLPPFQTEVREEIAKSIISTNSSPDVPFSLSINPFRGCEHGCCYCFARPTHCYWGHSAGLDFETKLTAKVNAVALLEEALAKKTYQVSPIALGVNTDAYQPIEKKYEITRGILKVLAKAKHPVVLVTKSALVLRDLDILAPMAKEGLVSVAFSVTTLDHKLSRLMEPRASAPHRRIAALEALNEAGVPTMVLVAPVIPQINDQEIDEILKTVADIGVCQVGYVLLRLPHEVSDLFRDWLSQNFPDRAKRVMSILQSMRGGQDYQSGFGQRMRGDGVYADFIKDRFKLAVKRLGLNGQPFKLRQDLFEPPVPKGGQMRLV